MRSVPSPRGGIWSFSTFRPVLSRALREVVVFHSTEDSLLAQQAELPPFAVVADPDKRLYRDFGVESSWKAALHPGAWRAELRGMLAKRKKLAFDFHGGPRGLPADFLLGPDGTVLACRYGTHGYDQWSVDELLRLAADPPVAHRAVRGPLAAEPNP